MGGGWPFPSIAADSVPGAPPTGGAAAAANSWQTLLANPQLDAVQQELGRLVSTVVMPIVSELISQPQARIPHARRQLLLLLLLSIPDACHLEILHRDPSEVLLLCSIDFNEASFCRWAPTPQQQARILCRTSASASRRRCSPAWQRYSEWCRWSRRPCRQRLAAMPPPLSPVHPVLQVVLLLGGRLRSQRPLARPLRYGTLFRHYAMPCCLCSGSDG